MAAYETAISETSTAAAPWYVIPANRKWYRNLVISQVLVSTLKGRTRLYTWNPRYPFGPELRSLLAKALDLLPAAERRRYFAERRRPRRAGKPL